MSQNEQNLQQTKNIQKSQIQLYDVSGGPQINQQLKNCFPVKTEKQEKYSKINKDNSKNIKLNRMDSQILKEQCSLFRKKRNYKRTQEVEIKRWSQKENKMYEQFIHKHINEFCDKSVKRKKNIFVKMSHFIKTRDSNQCRSHHQKFYIKYLYKLNYIKIEQDDNVSNSNDTIIAIKLDQLGELQKSQAQISPEPDMNIQPNYANLFQNKMPFNFNQNSLLDVQNQPQVFNNFSQNFLYYGYQNQEKCLNQLFLQNLQQQIYMYQQQNSILYNQNMQNKQLYANQIINQNQNVSQIYKQPLVKNFDFQLYDENLQLQEMKQSNENIKNNSLSQKENNDKIDYQFIMNNSN